MLVKTKHDNNNYSDFKFFFFNQKKSYSKII